MKCPMCKRNMANIMHFEYGKNYTFSECKYCRAKTHKKRIHFDDLEGGNKYENTSTAKRI